MADDRPNLLGEESPNSFLTEPAYRQTGQETKEMDNIHPTDCEISRGTVPQRLYYPDPVGRKVKSVPMSLGQTDNYGTGLESDLQTW